MNKKINKKGFTLIELIVVIAILAVLGLLLVPQISGYITASKEAVGVANVKGCYSALAAKKANDEAKLGMTITVDPNCKEETGLVTWTDTKDTNKVYSYNVATGEIKAGDKVVVTGK